MAFFTDDPTLTVQAKNDAIRMTQKKHPKKPKDYNEGIGHFGLMKALF